MLDHCSRVSCLHKELLVCLSPVFCSARLGVSVFRRVKERLCCFFYRVGKTGLGH